LWCAAASRPAVCQGQSSGVELIKVPDEVVQRTNHLYHRNARRPWSVLEWPGLLRMLDRCDSSYRE
jgi:hypothetical protein